MVVGRYKLIGLPTSLPAGLEKSRAEVRRFKGSVNTGAGAAGSSDACLSGTEAPDPACWANPEGTPAINDSMTAATARSRLPACPRTVRAASFWRSNTRVPYKCMFPLHDLLRHVGCHSSRRTETLSGRKIMIPRGDLCFFNHLRPSHTGQYALGPKFVPKSCSQASFPPFDPAIPRFGPGPLASIAES